MKAILNNYRQSPRKVRMVANLIKGKTAGEAIASLNLLAKRASDPLKTLVESAVANANSMGVSNPEALIIKDLRVDSGFTMKRMMPGSRGRGFIIRKKTSNVFLSLAEKVNKKKKSAPEVKEEVVKTVKKAKVTKAKAK